MVQESINYKLLDDELYEYFVKEIADEYDKEILKKMLALVDTDEFKPMKVEIEYYG